MGPSECVLSWSDFPSIAYVTLWFWDFASRRFWESIDIVLGPIDFGMSSLLVLDDWWKMRRVCDLDVEWLVRGSKKYCMYARNIKPSKAVLLAHTRDASSWAI